MHLPQDLEAVPLSKLPDTILYGVGGVEEGGGGAEGGGGGIKSPRLIFCILSIVLPVIVLLTSGLFIASVETFCRLFLLSAVPLRLIAFMT